MKVFFIFIIYTSLPWIVSAETEYGVSSAEPSNSEPASSASLKKEKSQITILEEEILDHLIAIRVRSGVLSQNYSILSEALWIITTPYQTYMERLQERGEPQDLKKSENILNKRSVYRFMEYKRIRNDENKLNIEYPDYLSHMVGVKKALIKHLKDYKYDSQLMRSIRVVFQLMTNLEVILVKTVLNDFSQREELFVKEGESIQKMISNILESVRYDLEMGLVVDPLKEFFSRIALHGDVSESFVRVLHESLKKNLKNIKSFKVSKEFYESFSALDLVLRMKILDFPIDFLTAMLKVSAPETIADLLEQGRRGEVVSGETLLLDYLSNEKQVAAYLKHVDFLFRSEQVDLLAKEFQQLILLLKENGSLEKVLTQKGVSVKIKSLFGGGIPNRLKTNIKLILTTFLSQFSVKDFNQIEYFLNNAVSGLGISGAISSLAYEKAALSLQAVSQVLSKLIYRMNSLEQLQRFEHSDLLTYRYEVDGHAKYEIQAILEKIKRDIQLKRLLLYQSLKTRSQLPRCSHYFLAQNGL